MSTVQPAETGTTPEGHHDERDHPSFLAHHFDTPEQQHESGKLGMWLFLATEVLFFGGLFCAYTLYRVKNPDVFAYAHQFLDTFWGAFNTGILIFSSLTMAWAVRNAQLGQRKQLIINLSITIACAFIFLGVKYIEYGHKIHEGLLPGNAFFYDAEAHAAHGDAEHGEAGAAGHEGGEGAHDEGSHAGDAAPEDGEAPHEEGAAGDPARGAAQEGGDTTAAATAVRPPAADVEGDPSDPLTSETVVAARARDALEHGIQPKRLWIFFGIYFGMTGLHAFHIIAGIGFLFWILRRSIRGDFSPQNFTAVDNVGLYWHLVDLIWIYLFPLLYLLK